MWPRRVDQTLHLRALALHPTGTPSALSFSHPLPQLGATSWGSWGPPAVKELSFPQLCPVHTTAHSIRKVGYLGPSRVPRRTLDMVPAGLHARCARDTPTPQAGVPDQSPNHQKDTTQPPELCTPTSPTETPNLIKPLQAPSRSRGPCEACQRKA